MKSDEMLERVALLHVTFVCALALVMALEARPLAGAWLGGGSIGVAFLLFWGIGTALLEGRKWVVVALGVAKVVGYMALVGALLTHRLEVDPIGFLLGVGSFVAAALAALAWREAETRLSLEGSV